MDNGTAMGIDEPMLEANEEQRESKLPGLPPFRLLTCTNSDKLMSSSSKRQQRPWVVAVGRGSIVPSLSLGRA
jgi:hypothetical protein